MNEIIELLKAHEEWKESLSPQDRAVVEAREREQLRLLNEAIEATIMEKYLRKG